MLDRWTSHWVQPPLQRLARRLAQWRITPGQVSVAGFVVGMLALPLLALGAYLPALLAVLLNRLGDGLDGALARHTGTSSDAGGFLDIGLDFIFYAAVVVGFALADPMANALAATLLLFAFIGTGSTFLAFAIMATKHGLERPRFRHKAFFYLDGLTEGTETILAFVIFCLWPERFATWALIFAAACAVTTMTRLWGGYRTLKIQESQGEKQ